MANENNSRKEEIIEKMSDVNAGKETMMEESKKGYVAEGINTKEEDSKNGKYQWIKRYRIEPAWLNVKELLCDPGIQRHLNIPRVKRIVEDFNVFLVNPIKVSFRDGGYHVFDGMHTLEALKRVYKDENFEVECRVYHGLTREIEARLFAQQTGFSEEVSMTFKLRALKVAKDVSVLGFINRTEDVGFKVDLEKPESKNGHLGAVCAAYEAYIALGAARYKAMMETILKTWGGEAWSVNKNMIAGMSVFMNMNGGVNGDGIKTGDFIRRLRPADHEAIRKRAMRYRGMSIGSAYGVAISDFYEGAISAA